MCVASVAPPNPPKTEFRGQMQEHPPPREAWGRWQPEAQRRADGGGARTIAQPAELPSCTWKLSPSTPQTESPHQQLPRHPRHRDLHLDRSFPMQSMVDSLVRRASALAEARQQPVCALARDAGETRGLGDRRAMIDHQIHQTIAFGHGTCFLPRHAEGSAAAVPLSLV